MISARLLRADKIPGWMKPAELTWLEQHAEKCERVIELGSFKGRSSVALAAAKELICVDHWVVDLQEAVAAPLGQDIYDEFCNNVRGAGNIKAVRCDLRDPAAVEELIEFFKESADMVFVDAAHDEESVTRDLHTAKQLLKPGGLLCGHDYSGSWPGVIAAVTKHVPDAKPTGAGTIWACPIIS